MNENIKNNYTIVRTYHVCVGLHKSGTTWVNSYIHKKYRKIGMTIFDSNNRYTELFGDNDDSFFYNVSKQDRIKFLEHCRLII